MLATCGAAGGGFSRRACPGSSSGSRRSSRCCQQPRTRRGHNLRKGTSLLEQGSRGGAREQPGICRARRQAPGRGRGRGGGTHELGEERFARKPQAEGPAGGRRTANPLHARAGRGISAQTGGAFFCNPFMCQQRQRRPGGEHWLLLRRALGQLGAAYGEGALFGSARPSKGGQALRCRLQVGSSSRSVLPRYSHCCLRRANSGTLSLS